MIRQQLFNITTGWSMRVLGVASSPHKWRAACFTECAEKEMDVFDLMNLAGHSSPEVTPGYIRHQLGHLKQAYRETHPRALRTASHDPE
jgi:site-specific recombinase XerC